MDRDVRGVSWPTNGPGTERLADLSVGALERAARTFPEATGLGWDKMHPGVLLRCSPSVLRALVLLFLALEAAGEWPGNIGIVLVCLLPKPDGGWRPIGLLPTLVRL